MSLTTRKIRLPLLILVGVGAAGFVYYLSPVKKQKDYINDEPNTPNEPKKTANDELATNTDEPNTPNEPKKTANDELATNTGTALPTQIRQLLQEDDFMISAQPVKPYFSPEMKSTLIAMSQNEDIISRSKWQMARIEDYCRKYSLQSQRYILNYKLMLNLYKHLLFDDKRKFLYGFLPKAGCTTLRRMVFVTQGVIPPESANWSHISEHNYMVPALKKASFLNISLTDKKRQVILQKYYKFMVVRNPLERLASAYRDKIEHSLTYNPISTTCILNPDTHECDYFIKYRREILARYNHDELLRWEKSEGNFSLQPSFSHYVTWVVDSDDKDLDEHFASTLANTEPCRVRYNFYANFKNFSRDIKLLINYLHLNPQYFVDKSSHDSGEETGAKLLDYYSELSRPLKKRLFHRMFSELDFYYHLYPEDQWSHLELLGVNKSVYTPATDWISVTF